MIMNYDFFLIFAVNFSFKHYKSINRITKWRN